MKVAIIGYGVVGKATHHTVLGHDHGVDIYDIDREYPVQHPTHDVIFICIPTVNQQDIEFLRQLCETLLKHGPDTHICIRSTVPIGFASQELQQHSARVWYFPEFLRERHWIKDSREAIWIIGCADPEHPLLHQVFRSRTPVYLTMAETEILKLMSNAYAAMHVVFANHIYDISQQMGASYNVIQTHHDIVKHHDQSYLEVTEQLRGFGGKCLPKDLEFLISSFKQRAITQTLFDSIRDDNNKWPTTVRIDQ